MPVDRRTLTTRTYDCLACQAVVRHLLWNYDPVPPCACGGVLELRGGPKSTVMIATDDIPGGLLVEHAICHEDGTPRRFFSKSEIRQAANEAGWTIAGETPKILQRHIDQRGAASGR